MLDKVCIKIKSGDGGPGAVSFRREKFVPLGGPDGGDGGRGGAVIIRADTSLNNLNYFMHKRFYRAEDGKRGAARKKHGKDGVDMVLPVPVGTIVTRQTAGFDNSMITDLSQAGQEVMVARGGKGGLGNTHFVSSVNQVPRLAQNGEAGEEMEICLELKLIADVGIIGYPNAGKSSLLAAASAANPKIADYAFTTLEPSLGVVDSGKRSFVLAEIPGLIAGAHQGRGLGHDFLRHVVRTRLLVHLIDGSEPQPVDNMIAVNNELSLFDPSLAQKPQVVAVNKIDKPEVRQRMAELRQLFADAGHEVHFISACSGEGVAELMDFVAMWLEKNVVPEEHVIPGVPVLRPGQRDTEPVINKVGDAFIISSPFLEQIVAGSDITNPEVRRQITAVLSRPRMQRQMEKAGVVPGSRLRIGDFEWIW
jgi:GTP-binding protein